MANQKISELTALLGSNVVDDDALAIVDTSTTETKKIVFSELKSALDTSTGFVRITGDTMTGDLSFGDNDKAVFGAGSDLQIFHDGNHSFIQESGTGQLVIRSEDLRLQDANGTNWLQADTDGAVRLYHNNSNKLTTTSTGIDVTGTVTATAYNTTSDYRLKENVVELTGATERLKQLNPSRFNFIADADTTVDGFLAHEAQAVVPEAVNGAKDAMRNEEYEVTPAVLDDDGNEVTPAVMGTRSVPDMQGIDQAKLVPLLTAALQEAITKIETLETKVAALEGAE